MVNNNIKVYVVTIARLENLYIKEWVDHYINLGIDKIIIYDHNNNGEERIDDVIKPNKKIIINNDFRNSGKTLNGKCGWWQNYIFNLAYNSFSNECDWIIFVDSDEYVSLNAKYEKNIKNFLSDKIFDNYDCIRLNWKIYDDNNLIYYENKPLKERFTRLSKNNEPQVKSIYRTKKNIQLGSSHGRELLELNSCNCEGKKCSYPINAKYGEYIDYPSYRNAWINHYRFKTIEEYIKLKFKVHPSYANQIKPFFMYNEKTKEKLEYLKSIGINYN